MATRLAAIQALSGLKSADYAPRLEQLRKDPAAGVRIAAVSALAKMGERGAAAALIFLEDEDAGVRQSAVKVLLACFLRLYVLSDLVSILDRGFV